MAWAHAVLLQSTPEPAAVVAGMAVPISLQFNSRIDGSRSRLTVACANAAETALALAAQTTPNRISASLKSIKPGPCRVQWQVLATDGHITRGAFSFRVK